MSDAYAPLPDNDSDEEECRLKSNPAPNSTDTVSVGKRSMILLLILIILNAILAVTNGYYSLRITTLLKQYEEKPLSSLPHIDSFNGQYRGAPQAAGTYGVVHILLVVFLTSI